MALIFKNAEEAKNSIMASQQKEIAQLYEKWADEIGERAKHYSHKSTASAPVSERYYKELKKQLEATSHEVSNEIYSKIKNNMYMIADAVVADNIKWLESFGFSTDGLNAAFSYVPDSVVRNLITGQIYDSGWSLSKRIWGDNEQTLKDAYQIMAKGLAENKPIYDIAKDLENYVRPSAKKSWNPVLAMKNTKTGKIEYKRIYKKQVDYNAQRLARTLAQHSYQQSFIATTQKNPFITDYVWHSNGSRACELCASRDGMHFKKDELPMDHPNGMCTMEPTVAKDMVDQLANWFNSPDGTYPEIDEFAGNFGYEAKTVKSSLDFVNKYGMSSKSPSVWYNSLTQIQKAEAKALKDASGLNWNDWYEQNVHSTGDATQDFVKKYGTSTKSPNAWFNSLDTAQKAEAKFLKEQSGLTWNDWYNKNVYAGNGSVPATKTVKAFSAAQDKYLSPYGFSPSNMPKNFDDWSHKISHEQASEILKSMGTSWGDPHPYQQLMKYYNANLVDSNFVNQVAKTTKTATAVKSVKTVDNLTIDDVMQKLSTGKMKDFNEVYKAFENNGINLYDFYKSDNSGWDKEKIYKFFGKEMPKVPNAANVANAFDTAKWYDSVRKNNLSVMEQWADDWLKTINATEKAGVTEYTSNAYSDMNNYLRGLSKSTSYEKQIKACQKALAKASLPEETIVRRGSGYNMLRDLGVGQVTPENINKFVGAVVEDKGFVSTSPSPSGGFSGSIEYVIKLPKGSQAMYVAPISHYQSEKELLINCGGKYIVEGVEFDKFGDVSKIFMTLINLQ